MRHADVFYVADAAVAECRLHLATDGSSTLGGGGVHPGVQAPSDPRLESQGMYVDEGDERTTSVFGVMGPGIERVRVIRPNGLVLEAAVGRGVFAAWWSEADMSIRLEGLDANGELVAEAST